VHNYVRAAASGADLYDLIVGNARAFLRERTGDYFVRGTFTRRNPDFARDVFALFDAGFQYISLEPVVLPEKHPLALTRECLPEIFAEYDRLAAEMLRRTRGNEPCPDFFHFRIDPEGAPCLKKLNSGCGAGYEYVAVNPAGEIYPCHQFDGRREYLLGTLDTGLDAALMDRFEDATLPKKPVCRGCWAKYYCGGGCAANTVLLTGDMLTPATLYCEMLKKRTENALALYAEGVGERVAARE
jgi:uncharacterized protein